MLNCTTNLKAAAVSYQGNIPTAQVAVYDILGNISTSKGLEMKVFNGTLIDEQVIWPTSGKAYCPLVAFNWGDSPPLGITKGMLTDIKDWNISLQGYFHAVKPAGYTGKVGFTFGIVSSSYTYIDVSKFGEGTDEPLFYGISPDAILESDTYYVNSTTWLPLSIYFKGSGASGLNKHKNEEKLIVYWKNNIDDQWHILGADVTCPLGGKYNNLTGNAVTGVDSSARPTRDVRYVVTFHVSGDDYHFHIDSSATEHPVKPGQTIYGLGLENDLYGNTVVDLTLNDTINNYDTTEIFSIRGEEEPYILDVTDVNLSMSRGSASVLEFTTPITLDEYNEGSKTPYNATTYNLATQGFGVIRKNAYVTCSLGYLINNAPENIKRFSGFIQDIEPNHSVDENGAPSFSLRVTCMDARVKATTPPSSKIGEMMIGNLPNKFTYNLAGYFMGNATDSGPDTIVMPQCFDKWNLATVVRTVLLCNGYLSNQLWAKDENGEYLIEDRGIYLDYTMAYPYTLMSSMGGRVDMGTINIPTTNPITYYKGDTAGVKSQQDEQTLWQTAAEVTELPYNYILDIGDNAWEWLQNICSGYGLDLFPDVDGNICLQSPIRSVLYTTENFGNQDEEYVAGTSTGTGANWTREVAPDALGNVLYTSGINGAGMKFYFTGVGIKIILARSENIGRIRATIDDVVVDGITELDEDTGDKGYIDWVSQIQDPGGANYVNVKLPFEVGRARWYYSDWMHPEEGKNPCVYSICDNLTYGKHTLYIEVVDGTVSVEGFFSVKRSVETAHHTFDIDHVTNIANMDSIEDMRNDIIVIGNPTGAGGDYIHARATDLSGIYNPDSPTYIGAQRTGVMIDPKIVNQDRAEYLAKYLLGGFYKGIKRPSVDTIGLPWLIPRDSVGIRDIHNDAPILGMLSDTDLTQEVIQSLGYNVALAPFRTYWLDSSNERYSVKDNGEIEYSMSCALTTEPPKPSFEPTPEPVLTIGQQAISEVTITIDGGGSVYNPYREHYSSQYVNISFNLNWNAMLVIARICPSTIIRTFTEEQFLPGQPVNVILSRQGFTPAGKYEVKWDGWIDLGGGKGSYAPVGEYYVEIETVRYNTKESFFMRTDNAGWDSLALLSLPYFTVEHDRTIYPSPLFAAKVTPDIGSNSYIYPPIIYDDTNNGQGLRFDITLNIPAKLVMTLSVAHIVITGSLPENESTKEFSGPRFDIQLVPDDAPILEPGTYTIYFRPKSMTVQNNALLPFGEFPKATKNSKNKPVWVAWHYQFMAGILAVDKGGKTGYANGNRINHHGSNSITVTNKDFNYMAIETGSVLRRKLTTNETGWLWGVVTGVSTDTLFCEYPSPSADHWFSRQGTPEWGSKDNWEVGGLPIVGSLPPNRTVQDDYDDAYYFPYGYCFCWGGSTAGTYVTDFRRDANRFYQFFKIIS